jgi:hypothetical protein
VEPFELPDELADELYRRLGVAPVSGPDDVHALYRAWCATVPFDNVSKALAVTEGRPPPGDNPAAVVECHLATGLGGTCWSHSSVLAALFTRAGARTTVGVERMVRADDLIDFHSFCIVHDGDRRWVLDPVWVSGDALALEPGARGTHPVFQTSLDAHPSAARGDPDTTGVRERRLWHRVRAIGMADDLRYAMVSTMLDRGDVRAFCAVSGRFSGLPADVLTLRRTPADCAVGVRVPDTGAPGLVVRHRRATGTDDELVTDPDAAFAALGCTPEARRRAERVGLLGPATPSR